MPNTKMSSVLLTLTSSLITITLTTLIEPEEVEILPGIDYHFSIDYCKISIPPYITTMNAHCYCFFNPITRKSSKCSVPGPTFIFHPGTTVSMTWHNRMKGDSISDPLFFNKYKDLDITNLHTHGLHISPDEDDVFVPILPESSHTYKYTVPDDHYPGTHWLHPHHHGSVSFQMTSGLFSALLMKYSDDDMLGDDSLINMNENILLFHYYYVITTPLCNCSNTSQWESYFYYPPQFTLDDCISGKLCFQVFAHCYEYCSFPETQRQASSFEYKIESYYDDNFQLFLVNGQVNPILDLTVGTFRRLRMINTMTQYYIQYKFPISECEWYIIAIDGIFLNNDEVRSINISPYLGYYLLPPGGRLDVIVKCKDVGIYNIITSENDDIDPDLVNIVRAPELQTLFAIRVRSATSMPDDDDDDIVSDKPTSYPERPEYLRDLSADDTNICGCNTYFTNNNNTKPITWNSTDCGIVLNMNDDHNINGLLFDPNRPTTSLEYGKVYSFTFIPHMHPYHQHISPFQMMTDIGTNGFQAQAGDWYDTIGGPRLKEYTFRTYPIDFTGHQVMHCHILPHEDQGMMTFADILQPQQSCDASTGQVMGTRNPTKSPTTSPSPEPTPNPTKLPTGAPTDIPTEVPTKMPTTSTLTPTEFPTQMPTTRQPTAETPAPTTIRPTTSPINDICPIESGVNLDFIVLYDNSCGLEDDTCDDLLEFVGEVISSILDDTDRTRVQTMAFNIPDQGPDTVVVFENSNLQNDPLAYVQTIRQVGVCTSGGNGQTDLALGIFDALLEFDLNDDRIDKFIIINACIDNSDAICDIIPAVLAEHGIDAYIVNFSKLSDATNVITDPDDDPDTDPDATNADYYLLCVADDDPVRVCTRVSDDDDDDDYDDIINDCLLPAGVCNVPTPSPTKYPSTSPTPEPSPKPTESPTDMPTREPTVTSRPSPSPTPVPSSSPITNAPTEPAQCFLGAACENTVDCCEDDPDTILPGITCSCYTKMSVTYDDKFCCILKGKSGCTIDNDCCKDRTKCMDGVCMDKNTPTKYPTNPTAPTVHPTQSPTANPTQDTYAPTEIPTDTPSAKPTQSPSYTTSEPTGAPTDIPINEPTADPSERPTNIPTKNPTPNPSPTKYPSKNPTPDPTAFPTDQPTKSPTKNPTKNPAEKPTEWPTKSPTDEPTYSPTKSPTTDKDECFLGSICLQTDDCCSGDIDEGAVGITCDGWTKFNANDDGGYNTDNEYCCIKKYYDGCTKDEDCCRLKSVCWWGKCVNPSDTK